MCEHCLEKPLFNQSGWKDAGATQLILRTLIQENELIVAQHVTRYCGKNLSQESSRVHTLQHLGAPQCYAGRTFWIFGFWFGF